MADVVCTTQTTYGSYCARLAGLLTGSDAVVVFSDVPPGEPVPMPAVDFAVEGAPAIGRGALGVPSDVVAVQQFGVARNAFWPRSVASWLILSAILIAISVQLVSPTRRWRLRLRRLRRSA
jgi:hypothetical protein